MDEFWTLVLTLILGVYIGYEMEEGKR